MGPILAAVVVSEIDSITRFANAHLAKKPTPPSFPLPGENFSDDADTVEACKTISCKTRSCL
jgi:hypothetical protein